MYNKVIRKIKNYAFYGDTEREEYNQIKGKIENSNRITAIVFASVATLLILVMLILSFIQGGFASSRPVYIWGIVFSIVQVVIALASRKIDSLTYASVYLAISVFLLYGIAIATLTRPQEQTVTFMVMLIFVPLIFVDRPVRMAAVLIFYTIVFIVMAVRTKTGNTLSVDITDAVIFGILSIVSESVVYRAKIRGYVLENKLHIMSETDQLTGLNNRNCYEIKLQTYKNVYKKSIACIYIDVNGLHELNNQKGHKAGDEMLCYIAAVVREKFGSEDTFRIGGDEYVAIALDLTEQEVQKLISDVNRLVQHEGYHTAVGYSYSAEKDADLNAMIMNAESEMYRDKAEYYKGHDRRRR